MGKPSKEPGVYHYFTTFHMEKSKPDRLSGWAGARDLPGKSESHQTRNILYNSNHLNLRFSSILKKTGMDMDNKNLPRQFGCALNLYAGLLIILSIVVIDIVEKIPSVAAQVLAIESSLGMKYDFIGIAAKVLLFTVLIIGLYRIRLVRVLLQKLSRRFGEK
jgi:hypothetical protein